MLVSTLKDFCENIFVLKKNGIKRTLNGYFEGININRSTLGLSINDSKVYFDIFGLNL